MNKKKIVGAGVGLAALAAGAHFLYGKEGAENRKKVRGWALKARGEMLEKLEQMREVNEKKYHEVVDKVADRYKKLKQVDRKELNGLVKEAKSLWSRILKNVPGKHVTNGQELKTKRKKAAKKVKSRRATAGRAKKKAA
jgi:hypothetical protein